MIIYSVNMQGNILYRFPSLQRTASPQRVGRKEYVGKRWMSWWGQKVFWREEMGFQVSLCPFINKPFLETWVACILGVVKCCPLEIFCWKVNFDGSDTQQSAVHGITCSWINNLSCSGSWFSNDFLLIKINT